MNPPRSCQPFYGRIAPDWKIEYSVLLTDKNQVWGREKGWI
jgi:hypothetical protein